MDATLNVTVPSFIFQGYLALHSFGLWVRGAIFLLGGAGAYHLLANIFLDGYGLKVGGPIIILSMGTGAVLVSVSFITTFVVLKPTMARYSLLTILYAVALAFEALFCIYGVFYTPKLAHTVKLGFEQVMANYDARNYLNAFVNVLQKTLECCGTDDYATWFKTQWARKTKVVPPSCCLDLEECHNLEPLVVNDIYTKGCYNRFDDMAAMLYLAFIGILITSIIVQICGMTSSVKMAKRHREISVIDSVLPIL